MARWRLTEPHYLKVDGIKWEYTEVERVTGRPKRKQFSVPLYLNPNYEDDIKAYGQGDDGIIVSDGHNPGPKDVIFIGSPTPSMLPLDEEAKAISAKFVKSWSPPTERDELTYAQKRELEFADQISELQRAAQAAPRVEGLSEFMSTMTAMMKQQTEILAQLAKSQRRLG